MVAGPEDNVEYEGEISKIHRHLQIFFCAQFEKLFGKIHGNVKYFLVFCNLINILDVGADTSNHAEEVVKIEIQGFQGFLQLRNAVTDTALQKLLEGLCLRGEYSPLIFQVLAVGSVV
jgi:hypothetical protein